MVRQAKLIAWGRPVPIAAERSRLGASRRWRLRASIALPFLLSVNAASAAIDIQGTTENLRLNVENATIVDILNALATQFEFTYKVSSHDSRVVTGTYSGTVRETLKRVLNGNDYILGSADGRLEILILGASNAAAATATQAAGQVKSQVTSQVPSQVTSAPASSRHSSMASVNPLPSTPSPPPLSSYVSQNVPAEAVNLASSP